MDYIFIGPTGMSGKWGYQGPIGNTGNAGQTGYSVGVSMTGPTGPTGPDSDSTGPTGPDSDVVGPTGPSVPGNIMMAYILLQGLTGFYNLADTSSGFYKTSYYFPLSIQEPIGTPIALALQYLGTTFYNNCFESDVQGGFGRITWQGAAVATINYYGGGNFGINFPIDLRGLSGYFNNSFLDTPTVLSQPATVGLEDVELLIYYI
jgi:hypothetical protein